MKRKGIRKTITMITLVAMLFAALFGNFGGSAYKVEAKSKMKTLKSSDYSKMIQGGLNKTQITELLSFIAPRYGNLKGKALSNKGKNPFMFIILGYHLKHYDNTEQLKVHSNWYSFDIKYINKYLSSFSNFRYKKNRVYQKGDKNKDSYGAYTDKKKLHVWEGGLGWEKYAKINSAKYDKNKLVITFTNYMMYDKGAKYKAIFKKQKNGKYKLTSINMATQYYDMTSGSTQHYATLRGKVVAFKGTNIYGEKTTLYKLKLSAPLRVKTVLKGEITLKSVYIGAKENVKGFVKKNVGKTININGPMFEGSNGFTLAITAEKQVK